MKTLFCIKPNLFEMRETALPERKPGEVLLKLLRIGVCGTDYHAYQGHQPYFEYPRILGHEIVAEVAEVGKDESTLKAGDIVTVIPYISCGHCIACRMAKPNACSDLKVIGCHVDGAMREYVSIPRAQIISTPGLTLDQINIIEPMAIGLHCVNRAQIQKGEWVLVQGAGPIGLAALKFAKLAGARTIALDVNPIRLEWCKGWAEVDETVDARGDVLDALKTITRGDLPTKVIDATGNAKAMMKTFEHTAHGGGVTYVSLVLADITFSDPHFHKKELTLNGSRAATKQEFDHVISSLRHGKIDAASFISHRDPFEQAIDSILNWMKPESGVIKGVLEFSK